MTRSFSKFRFRRLTGTAGRQKMRPVPKPPRRPSLALPDFPSSYLSLLLDSREGTRTANGRRRSRRAVGLPVVQCYARYSTDLHGVQSVEDQRECQKLALA